MTDPINPIRAASGGSEAYQPLAPAPLPPAASQPGPDRPAPAQSALTPPAATPPATRAEPRPPAAEAARSSPAAPTAAQPLPNVHYRFNIDPKTNDVSVIMFDATSHKVLRTIPANELQKLSQGELLSLWA